MLALPPLGSSELLEIVSPYVPDTLVAALIPTRHGRGRPADFSPAQLFRTLLLSVLTPVRSFNLLCHLLEGNRSWRRFAFLPNRQAVPGPRMLHEFRQKLAPALIRTINTHLLLPLLDKVGSLKTLALIDATDLRAATNAYKKTPLASSQPIVPLWAGAA
jgi:hypothetical protein